MRILEAACEPGAVLSAVARRYDVCTSLIYKWRRAALVEAPSGPPSMAMLIQAAKPNDVDPQAWLADVLRRIAYYPAQHLDELLPWNWRQPTVYAFAEAA